MTRPVQYLYKVLSIFPIFSSYYQHSFESPKSVKVRHVDFMKGQTIMRLYVIIKIKVLCPRSGSHRKVKQNDKLRPAQDSGSLAVFKVRARDLGHYKGPSGAFVTYCNISCLIYFSCLEESFLVHNEHCATISTHTKH